MHRNDTANTLFGAFGGIINTAAGGDHTGINPEEAELSYKRIGHDLKDVYKRQAFQQPWFPPYNNWADKQRPGR